MAYNKMEWKDRIVEYPHRYKDQDGKIYTFLPFPGNVFQEGSPVNAGNLNNISNTIYSILQSVKIIQNVILQSSDWIQEGEFFKVKYNNVNIDLKSVVDVNIHLDSLKYARKLRSSVESFDGYIFIYSKDKPTNDIICDIKIVREVV